MNPDSVKIQDLKTDPEVFEAVWNGEKTFEIRFDDRNFMVGKHALFTGNSVIGCRNERWKAASLYAPPDTRNGVSHPSRAGLRTQKRMGYIVASKYPKHMPLHQITRKIMSSETHPIRAMRKQITRQKTDFQNLHQTLLNREQKLSEAVKLLEDLYEKAKDFPCTIDAHEVNAEVKAFLAAHKEGK